MDTFQVTDIRKNVTRFTQSVSGGYIVTVYGSRGAIKSITEISKAQASALRWFLVDTSK